MYSCVKIIYFKVNKSKYDNPIKLSFQIYNYVKRKIGYDLVDYSIEIGTINDDFIKNKITIKITIK